MSSKRDQLIYKVFKNLESKSFNYLEGDCYNFAAALHRVFGYKLGLLKGFSINEAGEKKKHILHAFGIDHQGRAWDHTGERGIQEMQNGYKDSAQERIEGKLVSVKLEKISTNFYSDEKEFWSKTFTIKKDDASINKAIKIIVKKPRRYFEPRKMATIVLPIKKNHPESGVKLSGISLKMGLLRGLLIKTK